MKFDDQWEAIFKNHVNNCLIVIDDTFPDKKEDIKLKLTYYDNKLKK